MPVTPRPISRSGSARCFGATPLTPDLVERLAAPGESLAEHLSRQLQPHAGDSRLHALAEWLVWNLDTDGYLRDDLDRLAAPMRASRAQLAKALTIVQSLDPSGVGARSLQECLLLQLRSQDEPDLLAARIVETHLGAIAERRYDEVARALGESRPRVDRAIDCIRALEPRPGRPFSDTQVHAVCPDVAIEKVDGGYQVVVRDDDGSRLGVSRRRWAEASSADGLVRRYLAVAISAAGRRIRARDLRRETVRSVVESIASRQPDFLEHGPRHLRPLSLRQVARDVGVHDSTVSRAVAHRYVDTPHGVFPLRSFFTSALPTDPGGLLTTAAARQRIRETIEAEDPRCPLADRQIVVALHAGGIRIARRTVVKYREQLGIASSSARRARIA